MEKNVIPKLTILTLSAVLLGIMTPVSATPHGNLTTPLHRTTKPADAALEKVGWRYGYRGYCWRGWYGG